MISDSVGLGNTRGAVRRAEHRAVGLRPSATSTTRRASRRPGSMCVSVRGNGPPLRPFFNPQKEIRDGQPLETL